MSTPGHNTIFTAGLSIVISAYNEEKRIGPTLEETIEYCQQHIPDFEIVVVDDGSKDSTKDVAGAYASQGVRVIRLEQNAGKGNGVRTGILATIKPYVLFMDADGATHIREIEKLLPVLLSNDADMVIGTRKIKEAHILKKQSFIRRFMGGFFTVLSRVVTRTNYSDYMCGFKLFKSGVAKKLASLQTTKRFTFDTEYLCIARERRLKVIEIPITWEDKAGSKVRTVSDTASSLKDLGKILFYSLVGRYRR